MIRSIILFSVSVFHIVLQKYETSEMKPNMFQNGTEKEGGAGLLGRIV